MSQALEVFYFDMGGQRPHKNAERIRVAAQASGLELSLTIVTRCLDIPGEPGAETLLLREPFPYGAIIIQAEAERSQQVTDAALLGLGESKLNKERMIYLSSVACNGRGDGAHYVHARGGNGHLSPQDAERIAELLKELTGHI